MTLTSWICISFSIQFDFFLKFNIIISVAKMVGPRRSRRKPGTDNGVSDNSQIEPLPKKLKKDSSYPLSAARTNNNNNSKSNRAKKKLCIYQFSKDTSTNDLNSEGNNNTKHVEAELCKNQVNSTINQRAEQHLDPYQKELLCTGLRKGNKELNIRGHLNASDTSHSIIHLFQNLSLGIKSKCQLKKVRTLT